MRLEHAGISVNEFSPFPIAPHDQATVQVRYNSAQCAEMKLNQAVAGDRLIVLRRTGGGGGHSLSIDSFSGEVSCQAAAALPSDGKVIRIIHE